MNPSTNNPESWMLFINNCELIFKLYQLRKRSRNRQQKQQLQEMEDSRSGYSQTETSRRVVPTQGSHVNSSYIEEIDATVPTIQLHSVIDSRVKMVDTAIQTSGEWKDILNSIQQPCYSLIDTQKSFKDAASTSRDIEMKCLTSDGRERVHGYCNNAYEPDTQLVEKETECHRLRPKSVKFSGCEIIEEPCRIYEMLCRRKWYSRHLKKKEGKWGRIRQMNLHQQGEILSYNGCVMHEMRDVAFAQARFPLNPANFYFKVTVLETGSDNYIAVGLTHKRYPSYEMPGWRKMSVGYHADDGKLYDGKANGFHFGPKLQSGDELCFGLLFTEGWTAVNADSSEQQSSNFISAYDQSVRNVVGDPEVTFTKVFVMLNGRMLGVKVVGLIVGEYYPSVGLLSEGAAVKVDFLPTLNSDLYEIV